MKLRTSILKTISQKELRDLLRDRRTLFVMIVLPLLLYPLLLIGFMQLVSLQVGKLEEREALIVTVGTTFAPELSSVLDTARLLKQVDSTNWEEKIKNGEIEAAIHFAEGFEDSVIASLKAPITVYYNSSRDISREALNRIRKILDDYTNRIVEQRIVALNSDPAILNPVEIVETNLASDEQRQGLMIGQFLGYILIFITLTGALYAAIDLTAGEKERGTLETLLVTPVSREEIVYGKFIAVTVIAMMTAVLNLISMGLTAIYAARLLHGASSALPNIAISPLSLLLVLIIVLPLAVLFSGLCLAVAVSARNYKEGQSLLSPLYLAAILPAMVSMLPGIEVGPVLALVPIANVSVLIKEFMIGNYPWLETLITFGSTSIFAVLSLAWATSQFKQEAVIFRHAEDVKWNPFQRRPLALVHDYPTPGAAMLLAMVVIILLGLVGSYGMEWSPMQSILASQAIVILPLLFVVYRGRYQPKKIFSLQSPKFAVWPAALLVASGGWLVTLELTAIQHAFLPFPDDLLKQFEDLFLSLDKLPIWSAVATIAMLPAIGEELLCRGFILSSVRPRLGNTAAVIFTAVVFGILHMNPYRLLPTIVLGLLLGFLVVRSGSIFPAMLCHFTNNAFSYLVQKYQSWFEGITWLESDTNFLPWFVVAAGVVVLTIGIVWILYLSSEEERPMMNY